MRSDMGFIHKAHATKHITSFIHLLGVEKNMYCDSKDLYICQHGYMHFALVSFETMMLHIIIYRNGCLETNTVLMTLHGFCARAPTKPSIMSIM